MHKIPSQARLHHELMQEAGGDLTGRGDERLDPEGRARHVVNARPQGARRADSRSVSALQVTTARSPANVLPTSQALAHLRSDRTGLVCRFIVLVEVLSCFRVTVQVLTDMAKIQSHMQMTTEKQSTRQHCFSKQNKTKHEHNKESKKTTFLTTMF